MGPLSIEQALAEEAAAIHDISKPEIKAIVDTLHDLAVGQGRENKREDKDADVRSGDDEDRIWVKNRKEFYCTLGRLKSTALCFSGGGIRSATFCLGVIQALARHSVAGPATSIGDYAPYPDELENDADNSLLSRFQYLSTVSGGGYIGSWLSAWRRRDDFPTVWQNLATRPDGPDAEPAEISWLRAYSNFLTPKTGLLSADTWTGAAIYLRNLLLNWLVIIPAVAAMLLVLKIMIALAVGVARIHDAWWPHLITALIGVTLLVLAQAFTTKHRPTRRPPTPKSANEKDSADAKAGVTENYKTDKFNVDQKTFLLRNLIWSGLSAFFVTSALTSYFGAELAGGAQSYWAVAVGAGLGVLIFAGGALAGRPYKFSGHDFYRWAASGLVYGGLVGLGAHLYGQLMPYTPGGANPIWMVLLPVILGVPWILLAQLLADMVFVGLVSYEDNSDADREWLGRAAGWMMAVAFIWIATTFVTFAGGYFLVDYVWGQVLAPYVAGIGGVAGVVTAWLGKNGVAVKSKPGTKDAPSIWSKIGLAVAGPLFAVVLVVAISAALDLLLLGDSLIVGLTAHTWRTDYILWWLGIGLVAAFVIAAIASRNVNINRFSIHALYRNRLMRAYLGASRQQRCPDAFTGFDGDDNVPAHKLWPPKPYAFTGSNTFCLFHVVNITLNVVKTARLAWQQRKAESFTVSPLHCGAADQGYRPSGEYGGPRAPFGLSLGTAMAISGAAASPSMGYHTSPSISLLLALFNVRLGWWLGNPGPAGEKTYKEEGPSTAIRPLVEETFGLTTDNKPWVYLSDGGHFENLGIYEMVRRRCHFILAIDAGCDPDFEFADLGNALRKTYIDLGIRIRFKELDMLKNRPGPAESNGDIPYFAVGTINYQAADGEACENGYILYVKPAYHGTSKTEGAGVRSYANASREFPHESTADQWFSESQFESYRSLALDIADTFLDGPPIWPGESGNVSLGQYLASFAHTARI